MFIVLSLPVSTSLKMRSNINKNDSFVKIINPVDGSKVNVPIILQSEASDDVDYVQYALTDGEGIFHGSNDWKSEKKPNFDFTFSKLLLFLNGIQLKKGDIISLIAFGYKYTPHGSSLVDVSPEIDVEIKKGTIKFLLYNWFFVL